MKRLVEFILALICILGIVGYIGIKDGTSEILGLDEIEGLTQEELDNFLTGFSREKIHDSWGDPDSMLSGFWGDIYNVPDSNKGLILYYDEDGMVERIVVIYRKMSNNEH